MYGVCGKRKDGDPLNCARNIAAQPPAEELAAKLQAICPSLWAAKGGAQGTYCCTAEQVDRINTDTQKAMPFIVGCPACRHNFVHFWCILTCSPDQASFASVSAVQQAADNNATAVSEVDYWVSSAFGQAFFNSCKDVKFGAANVPAMSFIGGGAHDYQAWFDFLGTLKDKRFPPIGSPIQLNFRPENASDRPPGVAPMSERVVGCGDNAFRCSCSDCPTAQGCAQPPPGPPPQPKVCRVGRMRCLPFALLWVYAVASMAIIAAFVSRTDSASAAPPGRRPVQRPAAEQPLLPGDADAALAVDGDDADSVDPLTDPYVSYPTVEHHLQLFYHRLGELCGRHPLPVIAAGVALVALCCLGLLRFKVETDPQRLWVGPASQAAREKADYEASFGPFYRVAQLIISTQPQPHGAQRPPILSDANIRRLFDMQDLVDEIRAPLEDRAGHAGPAEAPVALTDVCYKPFGDACATQSVLQYWRLDRGTYLREQAKPPSAPGRMTPEYCFGHWYTECRSAYQAPVDPHVVLGGFPRGPAFTNYSAGATSFVVTYPLSSEAALRPAALAWERALLALARGELAALARSANLTLSFSTERSVEDELARESRADAPTVAVSYVFMLLYVAAALGSAPPPWVWWPMPRPAGRGGGSGALGRLSDRLAAWLFGLGVLAREMSVRSRLGLGLAGVAIVAASVAGALGLVSACGLWATLIIMEVIPFLVLAVGVDNMFVMAHAMAKQDHGQPVPARLAAALASAGPSITLAATCEVAAFALGGALSSMPAVRNFSLAAAAAVLLDFVLQVTVFAALLGLDARRMQERRADCLPCIRLPAAAPRRHRKAARARPAHSFVERSYGGPALGDALLGDDEGGEEPGVEAGHLQRQQQQRQGPGVQLPVLVAVPGGPLSAVGGKRSPDSAAGGGGLAAAMGAGDASEDVPMLGPSGDGVGGGVGVGGAGVDVGLGVDERHSWSLQRLLQAYMERVHAPLLAQPWAQCCVLLLFSATLLAALAAIPQLQVGLDQSVALPRDSYLQAYYRDLMQQLRVGPPLLLVVRGVDLDPAARHVERLCAISGCDQDSLLNRVAGAAQSPERTFIAAGAASWLDDFMSWLEPGLPSCCRAHEQPPGSQQGYCPPPDQPPCANNATACQDCRTCVTTAFEGGRPSVSQFQSYLPWFLAARPSEGCAKGGLGAYSDALQRADPRDPTSVQGLLPGSAGPGSRGGRVAASSFRTYYTPLNSQQDFIQAMAKVRSFTSKASRELRLHVYAYSLFHVFFEQYLAVGRDAAAMLGLPLLAVFCACWALSGSLWSAGLMAGVLASLLAHLAGAMLLAGIQVNAVSLVNLAMSLGIAVEFCAHVLHAYMVCGTHPGAAAAGGAGAGAPFAAALAADGPEGGLRERGARAAAALRSVGASVLSGITLTKLVGVAVLAFARTQIFEVYYFRLYLALVVLGAAHGLVLLPVLLAVAGPPAWQRGGAGGRTFSAY